MTQQAVPSLGLSETPSSEGSGVTDKTSPPLQDQNSVIQINDNDDPKSLLQNLKAKNCDRPRIAQLNINFLDPKFDPLQDIIKDNIDILLISETELDDTFPSGKFFIGYKEPTRLDRNKNGGGLLFFIRDDLDSKEIKSHKLPKKVEGIFIKLIIRNTKRLIMGGYNPDYRPVSLIPTLSKIFEKDMNEQISNYVDKFLSPYLFGYRRSHSTQQCLMTMTEMWRKALDEQKIAGALLTDLGNQKL